MRFPRVDALSLFLAVSTLALLATALPNGNSASNNLPTLTRDVCIIGGGSSGTYAAIRLRALGHSVVVVERKGRLGGHTETYTDPGTGIKIDIGVQAWHNTSLVTNYFQHLNVRLAPSNLAAQAPSIYVDFHTGKVVQGYSAPDPTAALAAYGAQAAKYPYLAEGFFLPDPMPADLLIPFGDFLTKYSLGDAAFLIFSFAEGLVDLLAKPTLYVMLNFGLPLLQSLAVGFLTTADADNSELYLAATAVLGADALLSSNVLSIQRKSSGIEAIVQTPAGKQKIQAKRLVISVPPLPSNLDWLDLTSEEHSLFSKFRHSAYYTGLIRNEGLPETTVLTNVSPSPSRFNLPVLPGIYSTNPTRVPGLTSVFYGSPTTLSNHHVKENILRDLQRAKANAGLANVTNPAGGPEWAVFSSHAPFELGVGVEEIQKGFYKDLYGLQGTKETWWTGAAWFTQDSSLLWQFTEGLLGGITGGL